MDFNFNSACSTPFISAPSSPQRSGKLYNFPTTTTSAPPSPNSSSKHLTIPFNWELTPGISKSQIGTFDREESEVIDREFEFDFSGQLERQSVSADELFYGGKIKPLTILKPPPRLQSINGGFDTDTEIGELGRPRSPISKKIKEAFSPRNRKPDTDFDPFEEALKIGSKETEQSEPEQVVPKKSSPFRVFDILSEKPTSNSSSFFGFSFSRAYKKLKLKDFLLFRSASEGRPISKATMMTKQSDDLLSKYVITTSLTRKGSNEEVKNSSFRSSESVRSSVGSGSISRRLSAHELHYTVNRAMSEEMKRKTFLPYKQGWLGCLGFNPTAHDISRGGVSMTRV